MRRIICCALLVLILLQLCGCSAGSANTAPTLTLYMNISTTDDDALTMIAEELDAYVYRQLGFHVRLHTPADYSATLQNDLRSGEPIDAAMVPSSIPQLAAEGLLRPLDDLLEQYGAGIQAAIHQSYFDDARVDGQLYTLPTSRDRHTSYGFAYNRDIAAQYGLDLSQVEDLEDLTPIFEALQAQTSDISPLVVTYGTTRYGLMDGLSDYWAVLLLDGGSTVTNLIETEYFETLAQQLYRWQQAGYLLDQTTEGGNAAYYLGSGQVLGTLVQGHVLYAAQESKFGNANVDYIPLSPAYYNSSNASLLGYAIPTASRYPEQAMTLLNLLYTDSYAANLLMYGIEGVHFVRDETDPSVLTYPDTGTPERYTGMSPWKYCNQYIADRWSCYPEDIWEQVETANLTAIRSPAVGFRYNNSVVARQVQSCSEVVNHYSPIVWSGLVDPDELLPEFRQALQEAGAADVIAEKQRQLDQFLLS